MGPGSDIIMTTQDAALDEYDVDDDDSDSQEVMEKDDVKIVRNVSLKYFRMKNR